MGGGQTSASIIYDNQLKYSFVDQEGGDFVTKDISLILNTSLENAERIKREFGYAVSRQTSEEEYFPVETVGRKEPVRVDERYLSEIIEARLAQIFETVRDDLEGVDALDLPGGFVLTGGAASLPGVLELAQEYFGPKVRLYIPEQMGMRNPVFTTAIGMVEYVAGLDVVHRIAQGTYQAASAPRQDRGYERSYQEPVSQDVTNQPMMPPRQQAPRRPARPERQRPLAEPVSDYDAYSNLGGYAAEEPNYVPDPESGVNYDNQVPVVGNGIISKIQAFFRTFFD